MKTRAPRQEIRPPIPAASRSERGGVASSRSTLGARPFAPRETAQHEDVRSDGNVATMSEPPVVRYDFATLLVDPPSGSTPELLQQAIAGSTSDLPQRTALERYFAVPLTGIKVHRGPAAKAALDRLGADAAAYRGHILLGDATPTLGTLAHEIVHVLQRDPPYPVASPEASAVTTASEMEAEALTQRIEHRARLEESPGDFAPLSIHTTLRPNAISLQVAAPARRPPARTRAPAAQSEAFQGNGAEPAPPEEAEREPERAPEEPRGATAGTAAVAEISGAEGQIQVPAVSPPTPGVTPEQVAAREQALAEARAALEGAETASGVLDAFASAPPTLKAEAAGQLTNHIGSALQGESQTLQENTPEIQAQLSYGTPPAAPTLQVAAPAPATVSLEPNPPSPAPPVELPPLPDTGRFTANSSVVDRVVNPQIGPDNRAEELGGALRDVRTTDPTIQASPGPAPAIPLEADTDPQRLQNQALEGQAQAQQSLAAAQQGVTLGPGPERVQPTSVDESHPIGGLNVPTVEVAAAPEGAQQYLAMNLPPEVQTAFDENTGEQMRNSASETQGQMQLAAQQRDAQHQTEVQRAQTENDRLVQQADEEQRGHVNESRQQIQTERQHTLDQQQTAVRDVETQTEERRARDRESIDDRVSQDRQAIQDRYQQAETDAQREVSSGERDAEERRRAAERDAENQSWWDRAVNFIRDAFNALVSAINTIFDAVRRAVNAVLDAARDFAIGLINAATRIITAAIAAFGDFLRGLVQDLLGSVFPELAAALTRFIDRAVEVATRAVEAVAEGLRRGVNALVEGLRAGINAIIDAYQAAVNLALSVLRAAVTGDWGELARQIFEAILRVLGIDPAAVYQFIGRVRDTLQMIIDNPGAFLGHVLDAMKGGIQKFADNFLAHLQAGIIGWLTGAIGGAGITLPQSFDLMGVLSIIQQILGLTWANIRQRAVRLVGERAVQALEFVASYIETLIQGGWAALWERIKNDLATLRDMVLDQIKSFLVERLIVAAITRLATMFNPVGALLNLVLMLYNFYTFLRDQLQRIFAVAQAIVNAINDIARGVIEPAAARVEGVLASLLPLALDLLARLIGLGNVGERVRHIIQGVQNTIWGAIDRLLERVLASFRGGGAGAPAVAGAAGAPAMAGAAAEGGDLNQTLLFQAGGVQHRLILRVDGTNAAILLASAEGPMVQKLGEYEGQARVIRDSTVRDRTLVQIEAARRHQVQVDQFADDIARQAAARRPSPSARRSGLGAAPTAAQASPHQRRLARELEGLKGEVQVILNSIQQTLQSAPTSDLLIRFEYFRSNAPTGLGLNSLGDNAIFGIKVNQNGVEQVNAYRISSQRPWMLRDYVQVMRSRLQEAGSRDVSEQGSRDLEAGVNARRLSRVGDVGSQRYAFVQEPPGWSERIILMNEAQRDEKLARAVSGATYVNAEDAVRVKGIIAFMQSMADQGFVTVGDLRMERGEFDRLWAIQTNANWIKNRFRDAWDGAHEWIPSNMIPQVIDRTRDSRAGARIADWIGLQHNLRSDTSWVIFSNPYWGTRSWNNQSYTVLNGHSGAVYVVEGGPPIPLTEGQNIFHEVLRTVFTNNPTSVNGFMDGIKVVFTQWVWNSMPLPTSLHPGLKDSHNRFLILPAAINALAREQKDHYDETQRHFNNMKTTYGVHG